MEKNAYLDAMGVTRWSLAKANSKPYTILVKEPKNVDPQHPILLSVLSLLNIDMSDCQFAVKPIVASKTLWDLRSAENTESVLTSVPLELLAQDTQSKRVLWQRICAIKEALPHD